jgi:hypothetical protein
MNLTVAVLTFAFTCLVVALVAALVIRAGLASITGPLG